MSLLTLIITSLGLAMDAFAVSLTTGLKVTNENKFKVALKAGIFFGVFQGLMPIIGWLLGVNFTAYIEKVDHWITFILLVIIGGKMLIEGVKGEEDENEEQDLSNKRFILLAIATSIDALAVGVSFAFLNVNIVYAGVSIAIITGIFSFVGVYIGKIFGKILSKKAEIIGGAILVLIGTKILLEHLHLLG